MKYYIVVGEASGDLHASNLMKEIYKIDQNAEIRFWGGDLMKSVGGTLVSHYKERAFMGFLEVVKNIKTIFKLMSFCKKDITEFNPDKLILIDNSGFNLRIAKWAKNEGLNVNYYIAPQVWASRSGRVKTIKESVDNLFVILPFEKDFYKKYDYNAHFVGHPLIDAIANQKSTSEEKFREKYNLGKKPIIALLPGSRKQEIKAMLSVMLSIINDFKDYQFVIAGAPSQKKSFYEQFINNFNVIFVNNETYNLLNIAHSAIVTSGTATLETALFKVPQVVCYKTSWLSYQIAKRIVTLDYISLVNLILNRKSVTELIQNDLTSENLIKEVRYILGEGRAKIIKDYNELEQKLGAGGASERVANYIVNN